ncbi:MAG: 50S ribosomal protein L19 [Candidatus Schekmanbacteria bacterium RIFCSPHIGHO2_02_FULL_38_11]|uniref:Large ribosomal subunit protein bL19 n=1 Tax=Candidatus Schekmanbacteria bacterium RIFCSPLOWO2_12_FULL_38_15 TaxID=1817883 RepID=A0A1F7SPL7_9BACT|nr:MAG: 50S ribosomal protein L19 [Candidatus Schekmanbacteria bacterium GWA2_38_9]OGL50022.1 MAG: 50S ribosomal protein L19 [Candidatus Schekmanbacteria bacterium RIFCSPHIGHO2_02_FULL_38_11]OGL51137.1 MAG: 50S ribosomal protein L19 [Candidatus Schekmanbacteria bacterium RIFCSPLOWO2_02_FULL_38_14]OGL55137.1 MAG: 50S ribosomal protein L19 [Candidatus Schekmanbacteria bacterium RIFCSPLOWO2_12_FULL_38_15]
MGVFQELMNEEIKNIKFPEFGPGDTVKVHFQVIEGEKERTQVFEGTVLQRKTHGINSTFTVRKISGGVGVERIFPLYSPLLKKIVVVKRGEVRRAKVYYLRGKTGKAAKVKEKEFKKENSV